MRAKAERLSEWENMTERQRTAVSELEKVKNALTVQARSSDLPSRLQEAQPALTRGMSDSGDNSSLRRSQQRTHSSETVLK